MNVILSSKLREKKQYNEKKNFIFAELGKRDNLAPFSGQ